MIQGFTMLDGAAADPLPGGALGGAIFCSVSAPRIVSCVFRANAVANVPGSSGGAIAAVGASPSFEDCGFLENTGGRMGGGAVYASASGVRFTRCAFLDDGAALGDGGAARLDNSVATLDGCRFERNAAGSAGGVAGSGGAVYAYSCLVTVSACVFESNVAPAPGEGKGGAVAAEGSEVDVSGSLFAANGAALEGGAMSIYHGSATVNGCTIAGNSAPRGGGMRVGRLLLTLAGTIIAQSSGGEALVCDDAGQVFASCDDLFANQGGDWTGCLAGLEGADGNFSRDPFFCSVSSGDFSLGADSPCLPGGNPYGAPCGLVGAFGEGCGEPTATARDSWGAVRARFGAGR